jgi:hypothetical protein
MDNRSVGKDEAVSDDGVVRMGLVGNVRSVVSVSICLCVS